MSKVVLRINHVDYVATLYDNETTRTLIAQLPLEFTMEELNGNEKYFYLPDSLPSNPTRVGKIHAGDLMLYGDNCLVLFHKDFDTTYSYTRIGKINNPDALAEVVGKNNINIVISSLSE